MFFSLIPSYGPLSCCLEVSTFNHQNVKSGETWGSRTENSWDPLCFRFGCVFTRPLGASQPGVTIFATASDLPGHGAEGDKNDQGFTAIRKGCNV